MTVHVLIPVFNRLELTKRVLKCLRAQVVDEPIRLIVIDDGSSDGTADFLESEKDLTVLNGDGSLWWGGAIELGLQLVLKEGGETDWVLMVNNDTWFAFDFVQNLLGAARLFAPVAVGSVICDELSPERLLSIGGVIDTFRFRVKDLLDNQRKRDPNGRPHSVDVLSGRGTLYPVSAIRKAGSMIPCLVPHYLADYEFSIRVRRAGYQLLVSEQAVTISADEYGNSYVPSRFFERYFSIRSASYLPAVLVFWWRASSLVERCTLLPRFVFMGVKRGLFSQ